MVSKLQPDELRQKSVTELQQTLSDLQKKKVKLIAEAEQDVHPEESIGTVKRNIARVKTIINEKQDRVANSRSGGVA